MIDCENEVYTRVEEALKKQFPKIEVSGTYVDSPTTFPFVTIEQTDSYPIKDLQDGSGKENFVMAVFTINVYSNKASAKKSECKKIMAFIGDMLYRMNFIRTAQTPMSNTLDSKIYRIVATYRVVTDGKHFYRR